MTLDWGRVGSTRTRTNFMADGGDKCKRGEDE